MNEEIVHHLNQTAKKLKGPSLAQMETHNQWAACALDRYHSGSKADFSFEIDGENQQIQLEWDSNFSKAAMAEEKDMANHGGVALAWFVMSVLKNYGYVAQTTIKTGVDYCFMEKEPSDDDLNFLDLPHYIEVSGILQEFGSNTLKNRIKLKHEQIKRGNKRDKESSVIVTLFSKPVTVKELHQ